MKLLSDLLFEEAQNWWFHKELRRRGDINEAEKRERASILSTLRHLKAAKANGGVCAVGRGGWVLHYDKNSTISNCGGMDAEYPQACIIMGIAVINSTVVFDHEILLSVHFPMPSTDPEAQPWGSCSFAPVEVVAALYACIGAKLHNIKPDFHSARSQVRNLPYAVVRQLESRLSGDQHDS